MPVREMVNWEKKDSVGVITVNNPPVNALSVKVASEILECLNEMEQDDGVRVVVVTGAGPKAFMAGADIKEFPLIMQGKPGAAGAYAAGAHNMFNRLDGFPKPTVAAINGLALGGGCELALCCDLRVAGENALLGLPEIKLGLFPGGGGTQRLPRLIGEAKAKELMYTGDFIPAREALRIGLVNSVVPQDEVLNAALELASKIARRPGVALSLIKQCVDRGLQMTLEEGLRLECDLFDRVFLTEDVREGVSAFIEKREPRFSHR
ncbi:MAG: enoyl-CoA hydratase [Peptococcaceae bacterium]|nr:enoyl-CoA hydratase [Peptococcaceae bacterium]